MVKPTLATERLAQRAASVLIGTTKGLSAAVGRNQKISTTKPTKSTKKDKRLKGELNMFNSVPFRALPWSVLFLTTEFTEIHGKIFLGEPDAYVVLLQIAMGKSQEQYKAITDSTTELRWPDSK